MYWKMIAAILFASASSTALAEVESAGETGFVIKHRLELAAEPKAAYQAFVEKIGQWWPADHTWSGEARNLYLEPKAGGCFCERLPDGGSALHMTVTYIAPSKEIRMTGGLGPLQMMGIHGAMQITLEPAEHGTTLNFRYTATGYAEGGLSKLAEIVDGVQGMQLNGLKELLAAGL